MHALTNPDHILLWDTDEKSRVVLSPDARSLAWKVRASVLTGGTLLLRTAELIEGDYVFESATQGELKSLLDAGMARQLVAQGKTVRTHADELLLNSSKQHVYYKGDAFAGASFGSAAAGTEVRQRVDALEKCGWDLRTAAFGLDSYLLSRTQSYKRAIVSLAEFYGQARAVDYFQDEGNYDSRGNVRGNLVDMLEANLNANLDPGDRESLLSRARRNLRDTTIRELAKVAGSAVSWLRPRSFVEAYDPSLSDFQFGQAAALAMSVLATITENSRPRLQRLLDPEVTSVERFVEEVNDLAVPAARRDLHRLLYEDYDDEAGTGICLVERILDAKLDRDATSALVRRRFETLRAQHDREQQKRNARYAFLAPLSAALGALALVGDPYVAASVRLAIIAASFASTETLRRKAFKKDAFLGAFSAT